MSPAPSFGQPSGRRRKRLPTSMRVAALAAASLIGGSAVAASDAQAVTLIKSDLDFIMKQIQIAEAHANGGALLGDGANQVGNPLLPYGLRTVDGSYNNLQPGQQGLGAADRAFPRLLQANFIDAGPLTFDPDGPGPAQIGDPTSYEQTSGIVSDPHPRVISNLVNDQSSANPAAVAAADRVPGSVPIPDGHPGNPDPFLIPNQAPDVALSAPYNSWFTFFGQFFDHGLDLVTKGGNGSVMVPLNADDPLINGPDGQAGTPDDLPAHLRFMQVTRATIRPDDPTTPIVDESLLRQHTNTTTSVVDQNQTYTSHPSHQVFLREYELNTAGRPVSTGRVIDGAHGIANWAEVKAQAKNLLGIELTDEDVGNVPVLKTDAYGRFIPDPATGFAQIELAIGGTASGTPAAPVTTVGAKKTGHAFLDDIAHFAAPTGDLNGIPGGARGLLVADPDSDTGNNPNLGNPPGNPQRYDNELLDRHFVTGDGRGNENIGLSAVHAIFHSEHNRLAGKIQEWVLDTKDVAFVNQWLIDPIVAVPTTPAGIEALVWNGERLFQAARFSTEMQYQHLVFEEFGRKMQPMINVFSGYETDVDPSIVAEFAHTVYRFGHSMLTEDVKRTLAPDAANILGQEANIGLIEAFLNPVEFDKNLDPTPATPTYSPEQAIGAIVRGTTRERGNELDEFVTDALRDNLLGLPLDLPTINMVRGRDTGVPSLQVARRTFYNDTGGNTALQPYVSWADFGLGIRHPESLVNFVAAYGKHPSITGATTAAERRTAAMALVYGVNGPDGALGGGDDIDPDVVPNDRLDFMNSTGDWVTGDSNPAATLDSDGFTRTGLGNIDFWVGGLAEKTAPFGGMLGSTFNFVFETQMEKLQNGDRFYYLTRLAGTNFLTELENNSFASMIQRNSDVKHLPSDVFSRPDYLLEAAPANNDTWTDGARQLVHTQGSTLRFVGAEHVVFGGTNGPDNLRTDEGDDTLHGDGGNDRLEGQAGNDIHNGGDGNDIITDQFGDDNLKGGPGNDALNAGPGFDLILSGTGKDFSVGGHDPKETFAGPGDDFIIAGDDADMVFANEGDDWVQGGSGADLLQGGNGDPFQTDTQTGHDVIMGEGGNDDYDSEGGDDIMIAGPGIERNEGMLGFDWLTHVGDPQAADADMNFTGLLPPDVENIRDRFDLTEGLSGWKHDDVLRGDAADAVIMQGHEIDPAHVARIEGLQDVLGGATMFTGGNIILGGAGSDLMEGRAGDDIIDGDRWLDAELEAPDPSTAANDTKRHANMQTLKADVFAGNINPGDIVIKRTIRTAAAGDHVDTAEFSGPMADYDVVPNPDDGTTTVIHARGAATDGTDTVRNVERLQFSDQIAVIAGDNAVGTGTVTINNTPPTEDQPLSASAIVDDANGVTAGSLVLTWQSETAPDIWTNVGTGANFTPGDLEVGLRLRVVATFRDGLGVLERVVSAPTAVVANINDAPTGAPAINDTTPQVGQTIVATPGSIADNDGLGAPGFTYQWQQETGVDSGDFANIGGATNATFVVTAAQDERRLRVIASFTDDNGTNETRTSAATAPVFTPPAPLVPASVASTGPRPLISSIRVEQSGAVARSVNPNLVSVGVRLSARATVTLTVARVTPKKLVRVRRIVSTAEQAGLHTVSWDGRDAKGRHVKAGLYRFSVVAVDANGAKKTIKRNIRIR
jgi:Animal haem peroxidase/FlgD Ig-like domain/RTX calcium-binding nonapeptide repeat (4 copies)